MGRETNFEEILPAGSVVTLNIMKKEYSDNKFLITRRFVTEKKDNNPNYNRKTELQVDHIKPKSKGGSNSFDNAQVLSGSHNASKNANIVDEVTSKYKNRVEAIKKPAASGIIGGIGMEVNKYYVQIFKKKK